MNNLLNGFAADFFTDIALIRRLPGIHITDAEIQYIIHDLQLRAADGFIFDIRLFQSLTARFNGFGGNGQTIGPRCEPAAGSQLRQQIDRRRFRDTVSDRLFHQSNPLIGIIFNCPGDSFI